MVDGESEMTCFTDQMSTHASPDANSSPFASTLPTSPGLAATFYARVKAQEFVLSSGVRTMGVITREAIRRGEVAFNGRGVLFTKHNTQHSIQISDSVHSTMESPGCFMNHSCNPNVYAKRNAYGAYAFIARRDIAAGEQLFFDYETTEMAIGHFSECLCASSECRKKLSGFAENQKLVIEKYNEQIADHLLLYAQKHMIANLCGVDEVKPMRRHAES